jgi:hypothetical protein
VKSDPFAPAASPAHIKNLKLYTQPEGDPEPDRDALRQLHRTDTEPDMPDDDEINRRATLVAEFQAEMEEHGDAENPTLVDLTDTEYVWRPADGDEPGGWHPTSEETAEEGDGDGAADSGDTPPVEETPAPEADKATAKSKGRRRKAEPAGDLDAALAKLNVGKGTT